MLVLDEATSALDSLTERLIQSSLQVGRRSFWGIWGGCGATCFVDSISDVHTHC